MSKLQPLEDINPDSLRNLKYIRQWYSFYSQTTIGQQAVAQLVRIPCGHNIQQSLPSVAELEQLGDFNE